MARSLDAEQIERDVARCTWHLLSGSQRMRSRQMRNKHRKKIADLLKKKQTRLGNLINLTLIHSYQGVVGEEDKLRYFQGYHDVASIFLSTLGGIVSPYSSDRSINKVCSTVAAAMKTAEAMGLDLPAQVLLKISHSHFRDALRQNFQLLTAALKFTIMPMIRALDVKVFNHLRECEMEPFFALSWILTWFSHDVRDTALVKRLFDVFIASHPIMPIYMAVAMVLHPINRQDILHTECDFSSLHSTLSQLPRKSSVVGWKFIGTCEGGEYVSGDEHEEERSMKVEQGDANSLEDNSVGSRDIDDEDSNFAPSLASSSLWSSISPVPVSFEEIIELSIHFMRRIPPRKLISLARTFARDQGMKLPFEEAPSISLFQQPPLWAVANSAPSLQSIKVQSPDLFSNSMRMKKKRKLREEISISGGANSAVNYECVSEPKKYKQSNTSFAIIAAGLGPDGDGDKQRARRLSIFTGISILALTVCYWIIPFKMNSLFMAPQTMADAEDLSDKSWDMADKVMKEQYLTVGTITEAEVEMCPANPFIVVNTFEIIENPSCPWNNSISNASVSNNDDQNMIELKPLISKPALSVVWKSSILRIVGNPLLIPKIDPARLFQVVGNFLKGELLKIQEFVNIFKFDKKRGVSN